MTTSASSTSRATMTGSWSSRMACSRRFRLMPWGRTRSVGRRSAPAIRMRPSSPRPASAAMPSGLASAADRPRFTGPFPRRPAGRRWPETPSRATPAAATAPGPHGPAAPGRGALPRSRGPRSAIAPATNGARAGPPSRRRPPTAARPPGPRRPPLRLEPVATSRTRRAGSRAACRPARRPEEGHRTAEPPAKPGR